MTTRYCLKYQLGFCPKAESRAQYSEPLFLIDEEGHRLELRFDCARCEMEIYLRDAIPAANDGISKMASPTSGT
jgi:putative protease